MQDPAGGEGVRGAGVRHTFTREMHWGEQERREISVQNPTNTFKNIKRKLKLLQDLRKES